MRHVVDGQLARGESELAEPLLAPEHLPVGLPDLEIDHELGGEFITVLKAPTRKLQVGSALPPDHRVFVPLSSKA